MPALDKPAQTKRCSRCAEVKPLTEFNRHPHTRDGRQSYCRECERARSAARVAEGRCQQNGCPRMAAPGRTYCADHLAAKRERARKRVADGRHAAAQRALRERYKAQGFCARGPGHGPATHGVLCANCAARSVAKYRRIMIEFATAMDDLGIDLDTLCPCGQEEVSHVDHILPDSLDGPDDFENLRYLGAHCNISRGNRTDWEPATSWLDAPQWSEPPNAFATE